MVVKAKAEITLSRIVDIDHVTTYYLLQSSTVAAPAKPIANPPGGSWKTTEPSYTAGSTNTLYFVDLTVLTNGSYSYSAVSKSSSYEAAKTAYNKAMNAQKTADGAAKTATNYIKYTKNFGLTIGNMTDATLGRNINIGSDFISFRNGDLVMAKYKDNEISLGDYDSSSVIKFCRNSASMTCKLDGTTQLSTFEIATGQNCTIYSEYTGEDESVASTRLILRSQGKDENIYADSHWAIESNITYKDLGSYNANISGESGVIWAYASGVGKEAQVNIYGPLSVVSMSAAKVMINSVTFHEGGIVNFPKTIESDTVMANTFTGGSFKGTDFALANGVSLSGISAPKKYTYTNNGITTTVWESALMIRIKSTGTTTATLGTSSNYAYLGSVKATGMTPCIKKVAFNNYIGVLRVNSEDAKIQLGYTLKQGASTNIPAGTSIYIDETILLV